MLAGTRAGPARFRSPASAYSASSSRTRGATSVPKSLIDSIRWAWGSVPTAYFSWNRDRPRVRIAQTTFRATVSGDPTKSEPVGVAFASNCSRV